MDYDKQFMIHFLHFLYFNDVEQSDQSESVKKSKKQFGSFGIAKIPCSIWLFYLMIIKLIIKIMNMQNKIWKKSIIIFTFVPNSSN